MSVLELEQAIAQLPPEDISRLAEWFEEFRADQWDRQIEQDVAAGKLDKINAKVDEAFETGLCKPVKHFTEPDFWAYYNSLPQPIQKLADKNFELLKTNANHPSLRLKKIGANWSVRIGADYRAFGKTCSEGMVWFWIGSHSEYDKFLKSL